MFERMEREAKQLIRAADRVVKAYADNLDIPVDSPHGVWKDLTDGENVGSEVNALRKLLRRLKKPK